MGIIADIAADGDRCQHCGRLLHKHYDGKRTRELLREWDADTVNRCNKCDLWLETYPDIPERTEKET